MTQIALTFDAEHPDHPSGADGCARVLDALAAAGARATFFVQGRWARARPAEARRIVDEGHLVGLHCHSHVPYPRLSAEGMAADLREGRAAVREVTGVDPAPWFRFPYGHGNDRPAMVDHVRAQGFTNVHWSLDSKDWCSCARPEALVAAVGAALDEVVAAEAGAAEAGADPGVALFHTWPPATPDALGPIVALLRSRGLDLVTVNQLDPDAVVALAGGPHHRPRCGHDT